MKQIPTLRPKNKLYAAAAAVTVMIVSVVGLQLGLLSKATTPFISMEAENGSSTASVTRIADSSASNGAAIQFSQAGNILLTESFTGVDGVFVSSEDFWCCSDLGLSKNSNWMSEGGVLYRKNNTGTANDSFFRMWTRRTDLANVKMAMDMKYNGFFSGDQSWHGINLWLNESFCTPEQDTNACTKVNDGNGPSGYAVDFMNRGGYLEILKKVKGDTRAKWPNGATSYAAGGTYYKLAGTSWSPAVGQNYQFAGQTISNSDGTKTIKLIIDGQTKLEYRDNGSVGGPILNGGRAGLRSDFANFNVDNIVITSN